MWFNYQRVLDWAANNEAVVTIDRSVGEYVVAGQDILRVWWDGELSEEDRSLLIDAVGVRMERTMTQDVGFGLRQLVDIADRALSPGTNDPTTAVQAVHELHRVLRYLVTSSDPSPYIADDDATVDRESSVRVVHRPQEIATLVEESIAEVHHYSGGSAQVPEALRAMVDDLLVAGVEKYRPTLERCRELVAVEPEPVG